MQWTVDEIVAATGGRLLRGQSSSVLTGINTDSRSIQPGECFIALVGENHDGHKFLAETVNKGAGALVVGAHRYSPELLSDTSAAVIEVPDTLDALGAIAAYHRRRFPIPLAGITGSNGKTSSKEMIASILSRKYRILKNQGNFNNLVGVPLTLLALEPQHERAVVEMGINVPGEMSRLVAIAYPNVGLITNVQPAHLEGLASQDEILKEKGLLWLTLPHDGTAVINLDDERLVHFAQQLQCRRITFSANSPAADVSVEGGVTMENGRSRFGLKMGGAVVEVDLPVLGLHQVHNALAAAAVCFAMGETAESVRDGLNAHRPVKQRMDIHRLPGNGVLVDDTYNANPASVAAALRTVVEAKGDSPCMAILGEMRELGRESPGLHEDIGRLAARLQIDRLVTLGALGEHIIGGALKAGMKASQCRHAQSHQEIVDYVRSCDLDGYWILVKGSRGMRMERVVEGILGQ